MDKHYLELEMEKNAKLEKLNELKDEIHLDNLKIIKLQTIKKLQEEIERLENMDLQKFEMEYDIHDELLDQKISIDISIHVDNQSISKQEFSKFLDRKTIHLIQVIGKYGFSRNSDLLAFLKNDESSSYFNFSNTSLSTEIKSLRESGYLEGEKVNLGSKGGYNFIAFKLSEQGIKTYRNIAKSEPVLAEMDMLKKSFGSYELGYMRREVHFNLERTRANFHKNVNTPFDFIVDYEKNNPHYIKVFYETLSDHEYTQIFNEMYNTTHHFHIIVPNENYLYSVLKVRLFKWITSHFGDIENASGKITLSLTTLQKFMSERTENKWETISL